MSLGIWENINFNLNNFKCIFKGFLRAGEGDFLLFRDEEGRLKLKVEGVISDDLELNRKSGYIDKNESLIIFEHNFLKQKILMYALPIQQTHSLVGDNLKYTDIFIVDEIVFEDSHEQIGAEYLIEFVDNFKVNHIFPHLMKWSENHERIFEIYGAECQLIQKIVNVEHSNRNSIGFRFEGSEVYIIKIKDGDKGIILYKKNLELDKREKIRGIISYILGCPLIFYGYKYVNKYMTPSFSYSKNINDNENNFSKINFQLPTVLSSDFSNYIQSNIFENLIIELYSKYEEYDLGNIFFNYWIAVSSNSITAAVHYGALFEKIQTKYMEIHEVGYSKILNKSIFKELKKQLELQLDAFELSDNQKTIFLNKIGNMNTYSQKDKMNLFCQDILLNLSDIENIAWQQRNDAAHGNEIADFNHAWKNTLILRELVNKLLLKILTSSKYYISYIEDTPRIKII